MYLRIVVKDAWKVFMSIAGNLNVDERDRTYHMHR